MGAEYRFVPDDEERIFDLRHLDHVLRGLAGYVETERGGDGWYVYYAATRRTHRDEMPDVSIPVRSNGIYVLESGDGDLGAVIIGQLAKYLVGGQAETVRFKAL